MKIVKKHSGLVFRDQFISQSNWVTTSPSNTSFGAGLVITHNASKDVRVMRDIPHGVNVLEMTVDYTPLSEGDAAGVILYAGDGNFIEVVESIDDTQGNFTDYKIICHNDEFNVFILRDNEYEFVTSSTSAFTKFGFVTKQGDTSFESLKAIEAFGARNQFLTFGSMPDGAYAEITYDDGTTVTETAVDKVIQHELKHAEQTLTVKIFTYDAQEIYNETKLFSAGDEYYAATELLVLKDGVELSEVDPNEIGSLAGNIVERQLEIRNPLGFEIKNIYVQIKEYQQYGGYLLADIALDDNNMPGTYADELHIPTLEPNSSVFFWIKFDKTNDTQGLYSLYTTIALTHE